MVRASEDSSGGSHKRSSRFRLVTGGRMEREDIEKLDEDNKSVREQDRRDLEGSGFDEVDSSISPCQGDRGLAGQAGISKGEGHDS